MTIDAVPELPALEPVAPPRGPWLFWATTLWGIAIVATSMAVGVVGLFVALTWLHPGPYRSKQELQQFLYSDGDLLYAVVGAAAVGAFAVLALAVRLSRLGMREYLGLIVPRGRDAVVGFAGLALLYVCFALASQLTGPQQSSSYVADLYRGALSSGHLPALAAAIVILAPVSEELLIRGFLLRGWAASRLGPTCAVLLTSVIWAAMHTRYEVYALTYIFGIGLLFGWLRQHSGSTLLTIFLHAIQNAAALVAVAAMIGSA
jgi:CAAX protease family protein